MKDNIIIIICRLKHQFFRHAHRIQVQTVPVATLMGEGRGLLRDGLLELPDLLHALYPPTLEDSANFSSILSSMGLTGQVYKHISTYVFSAYVYICAYIYSHCIIHLLIVFK